ncbi:hypothetical protein NEOLI_004118 [Neolecta irregularis DAH-3]|uniref:Uncharacterized protein n=1 Tax=Neolecta irregularis (strain DAH-3) TaxID=1198029 RepID=A0A1U7LSC6_NEOID|nr:hypothetical protein NEOLI_004118 [Neolecta irregularis DAH-3]|eukprot:OLL25529.1 hypothetical protein NEOLI_004118 [Neolecta irregularis DAH-3]
MLLSLRSSVERDTLDDDSDYIDDEAIVRMTIDTLAESNKNDSIEYGFARQYVFGKTDDYLSTNGTGPAFFAANPYSYKGSFWSPENKDPSLMWCPAAEITMPPAAIDIKNYASSTMTTPIRSVKSLEEPLLDRQYISENLGRCSETLPMLPAESSSSNFLESLGIRTSEEVLSALVALHTSLEESQSQLSTLQANYNSLKSASDKLRNNLLDIFQNYNKERHVLEHICRSIQNGDLRWRNEPPLKDIVDFEMLKDINSHPLANLFALPLQRPPESINALRSPESYEVLLPQINQTCIAPPSLPRSTTVSIADIEFCNPTDQVLPISGSIFCNLGAEEHQVPTPTARGFSLRTAIPTPQASPVGSSEGDIETNIIFESFNPKDIPPPTPPAEPPKKRRRGRPRKHPLEEMDIRPAKPEPESFTSVAKRRKSTRVSRLR